MPTGDAEGLGDDNRDVSAQFPKARSSLYEHNHHVGIVNSFLFTKLVMFKSVKTENTVDGRNCAPP